MFIVKAKDEEGAREWEKEEGNSYHANIVPSAIRPLSIGFAL